MLNHRVKSWVLDPGGFVRLRGEATLEWSFLGTASVAVLRVGFRLEQDFWAKGLIVNNGLYLCLNGEELLRAGRVQGVCIYDYGRCTFVDLVEEDLSGTFSGHS